MANGDTAVYDKREETILMLTKYHRNNLFMKSNANSKYDKI